MNLVRLLVGWQGLVFILILVAWTLCAVLSSFRGQYNFGQFSPYLVNPVVLVVGVIVGWYLQRCWRRGEIIQLAIVLIVVTAIVIPIYANAGAAVGGLFIAISGLAALGLRKPGADKPRVWEDSSDSVGDLRELWMALVLALVAGVGIWLVVGSQAALVLAALVAGAISWALWKPAASPPQWVFIAVGFLLVAMAVVAVMWLGNRSSWPSWLAEGESLSSARHTLWSDALNLWATEPLLGAGPGAFTPSSELASSTPELAAAHSLVLQVGAELGLVGVMLLAGVFLGGLLFAARGSRPVALIAITAWTALAIHTSIDHLEDFPIVAFMAGVVLAWSGFSVRSSLHSSQD